MQKHRARRAQRTHGAILLWAILCVASGGAGQRVQANASFSCGACRSEAGQAARAAAGATSRDAYLEWTTGRKRLLFYRVQFADDVTEPIASSAAQATLAEADRMLRHISYGAFSIEWSVTPVLRLARPSGWYAVDRGREKLMADARAAALVAGYDFQTYDLEVVRHNPVPGFSGGYGNFGYSGAWIQSPGARALVHELGHNLGLLHANLWDTSGPSATRRRSPPFPSGTGTILEPGSPAVEGGAFDPDSLIGHESVIGPGVEREYSDPLDLMGLGFAGAQFNAASKVRLGWLPASHVGAIRARGLFRLHAFTTSQLVEGRHYVLRIERFTSTPGHRRQYWIQFRTDASSESEFPNGVYLHWFDAEDRLGSTMLLDMTPGSGALQPDASLPLGRTFSDRVAGIHVTPLHQGGTGEEQWVDVSVELGFFSENASPSLALRADRTTVKTGEAVRFEADARDADQDALTYHWNFGDGSSAASPGSATKSWAEPGEYVVRLEVSDRKGGVASEHAVVTVGSPATLRISGRVLDDQGQPLAGVRVHNGRISASAVDVPYVWTLTDSAGRYTLVNLRPGEYDVGAFLFGFKTWRVGSRAMVSLEGGSVAGVDFVAQRLPTVTVRAQSSIIGEEQAGHVVFSRTGSLAEPLDVEFNVVGTSSSNDDAPSTVGRVRIAAGSREVRLPITSLVDAPSEPSQGLRLQLRYSTEPFRESTGGGETNGGTRYFPGWELVERAGGSVWVQTHPAYVLATPSWAELTWIYHPPLVLSVAENAGSGLTLTFTTRWPGTYVLESSVDCSSWRPIRTNSAAVGEIVVPRDQHREFYRVRRQD